MRKFIVYSLLVTFILCVFAGVGIFITGMAMNCAGVGVYTEFYMFFDDNPVGWAIMFGLIGVGIIGIIITARVGGVHFETSGDGSYYTSEQDDQDDNSYYSNGKSNSYSGDSSSYSSETKNNGHYKEYVHTDGYKVGDRYYDSDGSCTGYDVGDRHYDSDGNSTGYRVGDYEYDSDGNSTGYWVGDTFYDND